jgi:hypothetical protein
MFKPNNILKVFIMRKLLLSMLLMIIAYGAFAETKNRLYFIYGPGIKSITFAYTGEYDDSQTLEEVKTFNTENQLKIVVSSDLKSTEKIANSFYSLFNNANKIYGLPKGLKDKPEKLNFWIGGYLYVNGNNLTYPVYLGQGDKNKWWLGNENGKKQRANRPVGLKNRYYFTINDGQGSMVCFLPGGNDKIYVSLNC